MEENVLTVSPGDPGAPGGPGGPPKPYNTHKRMIFSFYTELPHVSFIESSGI